ncbi:MAG: YeeE/YedE family protein [Ignavibacteria bacterium]|nr:YeeE/YedE family protein [Ignavibacteria bacterium]
MSFNDHVETAEEIRIRHEDTLCTNESKLVSSLWWYNLKYTLVGIIFGIVFVKAEIISWFRIQEMFQLTSFFMYGVIGTAVVVGAISVFTVKKLGLKSIYGETITFEDKKLNKGQIYGALIFGIGWAITGACPGPLFAQLGSGFTVVIVTIISAITGTWIYGKFREKLPH